MKRFGAEVSVGALALLLVAAGASCTKKESPTPSDRAARPDAAAAEASSPDAGSLATSVAASALVTGGTDAGLDDTAMPQTNGEELDSRMKHVLEAIAQNNVELAADTLFPRDAYAKSHAAADPARAWDKHVSTPFRKSLERHHKRTRSADRAKFVAFELGKSLAMITPKKNGFTKPLWHVTKSKLHYLVDGKPHHLTIREMVAWRGAWYITRLD